MGSSKRSFIFMGFTLVIIVATVTYQNCDGTRIRSSNISVTTAEAESNLSNLVSQISTASTTSGNSTSTETTALNSMITYSQSSGVTLYYAESPLMGSTDVVDPIDYSLLFSSGQGIGVPTQTQMYFAFSNANGAQGDLVLSGYSPSAGTSSSTTTTTSASSNKVTAGLVLHRAVKLDSTASATATATAASASATASTITINYVEVGLNDGSESLSPGTIDTDNGLVMDMALADGNTIRVRSQDVTDDGDLDDVIQLSIYVLDSSGNENYAGQINMINTEAQ